MCTWFSKHAKRCTTEFPFRTIKPCSATCLTCKIEWRTTDRCNRISRTSRERYFKKYSATCNPSGENIAAEPTNRLSAGSPLHSGYVTTFWLWSWPRLTAREHVIARTVGRSVRSTSGAKKIEKKKKKNQIPVSGAPCWPCHRSWRGVARPRGTAAPVAVAPRRPARSAIAPGRRAPPLPSPSANISRTKRPRSTRPFVYATRTCWPWRLTCDTLLLWL